MQAIDRPFRFGWDFCVVWALLVVPVFFLTRSFDAGPWYSEAALLVLVSLFATFVLYGPVLLARQVIHSGARGRFAIRVLLSIVLTAVLLFGGLFFSGAYTESRARILGFIFTAGATAYLSWRLERHERLHNS